MLPKGAYGKYVEPTSKGFEGFWAGTFLLLFTSTPSAEPTVAVQIAAETSLDERACLTVLSVASRVAAMSGSSR